MNVNPARNKSLKPFHFLTGFLSTMTMMFAALLFPSLAAGQGTSVQVNSSETAFIYRSTVAVPFTAAQAAGNLNVVVVGWNDASATVASVTDSNGNPYILAATTEATPAPASAAASQLGVSQVIYYAKNIKAGPNTVTVAFNQSIAIQSIRIVEYAGLDTVNPLDTSVSNFGNLGPANSGAVTTNSANDLLFGAGTITTVFTGSGAGFNMLLLNGLGDIVEDQAVAAVGSYNATATFAAGGWVMQLVAFRAAGQTPPTFAAPTLTSLSVPSSPEAGAATLTLTGTGFEPGAAVLFSNTAGTTAAGVNCSVVSATSITCLTPSFPVGSASISVTNVDGQTASLSAFTFTASTPFATAVSPAITPNAGSTNGGTIVTISGSDFAAGAAVTVGGVPADAVSLLNLNTIRASLPAGSAGSAAVLVTNPSGTAGTLPGGYTYASAPGISFVQINSAQPASPAATASVGYTLAQTAGNLNIVVIGWTDATTTVQSVTDSALNTYTLAFTPTVGTGLSQAIYYAKNIAAGSGNLVTVTFSAAAQNPNVRILEYSGLDLASPLDDTNGAFGTGTVLDSGSVFTTVAGDLVIGAATAGGTVVTTSRPFITVGTTPSGSNVEHLVGPAAGRINATATQDTSTDWVMQAVGFRQAGTVLDFGVSVTPPASATVVAGNPATFTISVTPINGFVSPVTLTCSGLPLGTSCAFVPPTVTPGATAVTSTLTITTTSATPAATSTVTVTGAFNSLSHDATVSLTVTGVADFTIAAAALSPASVAAGGSSTSTMTVAPVNGFTGPVSLTCSVAPAATRGPTCSLNPTSVAGGSGSSTLTVSTTAATTAMLAPPSRGLFYAMCLPIAGFAVFGAGLTSRKKKLWGFLLGCLLFSGLMILPACGGSSSSGGGGGHPGTPAGTYTVTVTGTSGSLMHTTTASLTVQ